MSRPTAPSDGAPHSAGVTRRRWPVAAGVAALAVVGGAVPLLASANDSSGGDKAVGQSAAMVAPTSALTRGVTNAAVVVKRTIPTQTTTTTPGPSPEAVAKWNAAAHDQAAARWYSAVQSQEAARSNAAVQAQQVARIQAANRDQAVARYKVAANASAVARWNAAARQQTQARAKATASAAWYRAAASSRSVIRSSAPAVTRSAPARAVAPRASSAPSVAGGSVWDRLAQCESGGNWAISTGNGFYGGLQFTAQSWRAMGGTGMPNQASRETQIQMAQRLQAAQGWGAWPACTIKLGMR